MVRFVTAFLGFEPAQDERESMRRDQREGETNYSVMASVPLADKMNHQTRM
jgi:hypothetical protein